MSKSYDWTYAPRRRAYVLMEDWDEIFHCNESLGKALKEEATAAKAEFTLYNELRAETDLDGSYIAYVIGTLKNW